LPEKLEEVKKAKSTDKESIFKDFIDADACEAMPVGPMDS
jgi:hypothetical protein